MFTDKQQVRGCIMETHQKILCNHIDKLIHNSSAKDNKFRFAFRQGERDNEKKVSLTRRTNEQLQQL